MYLVQPPYLLRRVYPAATWRAATTVPKIYLSFDDGPIPGVTERVLDLLQKENVKAVFFCVGENVQKYPQIFERILAEGHQVGNHTYNHLNGWNTDSISYFRNVAKCAELVNSTLFRPPYGRMKNSQYKALVKRFQIIMWDVMTVDYDAKVSKEQCLKNACSNLRNGSVVLFHDSLKAASNMEYALPRFIEFAKSKGFEFSLFNA